MHQPDYSNRLTGEAYLPWTRFHAAKDYYDMGALVEEAPGLHLTINVVPSLMDQLADYARGAARDTYAELTLKDASQLDEQDRAFMLRGFFQLPHEPMVHPNPRYRDLLEHRGPADVRGEYPEGLKRFTVRDYRDLQVWFNLAWCGRELRRQPEIRALFLKGARFTEDDKRRLLDVQLSFAGRILPLYRRLMETRGIEISVSPYYHPILPLLCDSRSAREALPAIRLPERTFAFPDDARKQIGAAQHRYEKEFGKPARGMWPSEGSISDAVLALASDAGIEWLASDEGVLSGSLAKEGRPADRLSVEQKFRAYRWKATGPALFFRDRGMSDLIGFTYARWEAEEAVQDFVRRLREIHDAIPDDGRHYVVPVILDGENAWEHYRDNGVEFLSGLYRLLTAAPDLRTVTFSEYLEMQAPEESLGTIRAGSWIYGNLATWIGHPEKNRAWDCLSSARKFLAAASGPGLEQSEREMMIAEGSDWFWWYGEDHETQNATEFDALFRSHVKNVYRCVGQPYPPELDMPIKKAAPQIKSRRPVHTIRPKIDGKASDYFEWLSAGFATPSGGESMHRTSHLIEKVYFGYDSKSFYLRIDFDTSKRAALPQRCRIQLQFSLPQRGLLTLERGEQGTWQQRDTGEPDATLPAEFAAGKILEIAVPLEALGIHKPEDARFCVTVLDEDRELERFPSGGFLGATVDPWELDHQEWIV